LNGGGVKNLSNSPDSNDGLPAISPDGNWVAFVSDRGGSWAVWAVPIMGGDVQKLFDLPADHPWGDGDRNWTNERISWGP
jgi:Tol biopolymer transport system component